MVKEKIGKPKVLENEDYELGKIYEMSGADGEAFLVRKNPETGKLEEVEESGGTQRIQGSHKQIKMAKEIPCEHEKSDEDKLEDDGKKLEVQSGKYWVDIDGLIKYSDYTESAIRYWIRLTVIAKSKILSVSSNGGKILSELINKGVIYYVSSTGIRTKPNLDQKEAIVREIAKSDFEKVWTILQELRRVIPFHKQGKLIRFNLQEIDQWMRQKEVDN